MKTVIEIARSVGAGEPASLYGRTDYIVFTKSELEAFAELVRAEALAQQPAQPVKWSDHESDGMHHNIKEKT